jgi:hypothetical protein
MGGTVPVTFDHATKLLSFSSPNEMTGAVTYGQAAIGLRTAQSFVPEFESGLGHRRLPVADFAQQLSNFFFSQWRVSMPLPYGGANMEFNVAGFNPGEPYGRVYSFGIPNRAPPSEIHAGDNFGLTWGGQTGVVERIVKGYDGQLTGLVNSDPNLTQPQKDNLLNSIQSLTMQIPIAAMSLQDCVNLAIFLIRTTIAAQRLTVGLRGCGGPIDVATITRTEGLRFIQRKEIRGESQPAQLT